MIARSLKNEKFESNAFSSDESAVQNANLRHTQENAPETIDPRREKKRLLTVSESVEKSFVRSAVARTQPCPPSYEDPDEGGGDGNEKEKEKEEEREDEDEPASNLGARTRETGKWLAPFPEQADILERCAKAFPSTAERSALVRQILPSWDVDCILRHTREEVTAWFRSMEQTHRTAEVSPIAARRLYDSGITLLVQKMPVLTRLAQDIVRVLGFPRNSILCSLFCNQPGAKTLPHFDSADTLTVQITGSKTWRLAPNAHVRLPTTTWAYPDVSAHELRLYTHGQFPSTMPDENLETHRLEPGAMLYVPRGYWHETESSEESVSLHIHILPSMWADVVLKTLRARLLRDDAWRATAYRLWGLERAGDWDASKALDALREAVATLTPEDMHRPAPWAPAPDDRIAPRARGSVGVVGSTKGYKSVRLTSEEFAREHATTVEMSPSYLQATLLLADGPDPLSAKDLAGRVPNLSLDEALDLVRLLCDVGYARKAPASVGV